MVDLTLVIVDVSEGWETVIKDHERGYGFEWCLRDNIYQKKEKLYPLGISYPFGSPRAGLDAITDTVRIASESGAIIYGTTFLSSWCIGDEQPAHCLMPYISKENNFTKHTYDAFTSEKFSQKVKEDNPTELFILGYDRDICVLETVKGAIAKGYNVITSEHVMFTRDNKDGRASRKYYRENTEYLESLEDVFNYVNRKNIPPVGSKFL